MPETTKNIPPLVQFYEDIVERNYTIEKQGLIFSYTKIVRSEKVKTDLILNIRTADKPSKIIYNGKECKLIEVK